MDLTFGKVYSIRVDTNCSMVSESADIQRERNGGVQNLKAKQQCTAVKFGSPSTSVIVLQAGGVVGVDSVVSLPLAISSDALQLFVSGSLVKSSLSCSDIIGGGSDDEYVRCLEWRNCCR
uniref:Uncharacterized protein n=1 Tax=Anopheles culicifacies TaxID=139723 RepID=A0A182MMI3_9DIPT